MATADHAKKISELAAANSIVSSDYLVVVANTSGTATTKRVTANNVRSFIVSASVPANASSTGVAGQIAYDSNSVYVCVATNTWKKVALSTW